MTRPLLVTVIVLALVIPILLAGGLLVRGYVRASFQNEEQARSARALTFMTLRLQIDEETGVRGFAATHDRLFLLPYQDASAALPGTLGRLVPSLKALGLDDAVVAAKDAQATNALWQRTVAAPLIAERATDAHAVERHGKELVDRYRLDVQRVQTSIVNRENQLDADTQTAIDRIGLLVVGAVVVLVALGIAFGIYQTRVARRVVVHERESAELRAAFDAEKRIADTLQEAFVLKSLPSIAGVSFSATYVPATDEANVGGDRYDCIQLSRDRVMFVIGDVAGHGLDAAVAMNNARQELVSAAVFDAEPGELLVRVNAELLRQRARMVTVACGYADARTFEFTYATAGHPPPLLVEPGRAPRLLQCGGLPLAAIESATYRSFRIQSVPGAVLVLYTDGALEHSRDVLAGETILLEAVSHAIASGVHDIAGSVRDGIFKERRVGDDVAIMTVAFSGLGAAGDGLAAGSREAGTHIVPRRTIA
jgi:serine phosphatase RsbU (regulator of sigma subunit)